MEFFKMFKQPYLDAPDDFGGGDPSPANDDMILPDTDPAGDPPPSDPPPGDPAPASEPEKPKVKLKYNHEEKEYTLDEVVPLAQKGMNYDKLQERLQSLEKSPAMSYVEKVAKANNMTVEQVVEAWQKADEQREIEALAQRENVPYEIAERLYKTESKINQLESMYNQDKQTKADQEKQQAEYDEFFNNYPDVKAEDIPKSVWEYRAKTGKSLTDAMIWHENQVLKDRIQKLEQNANNKK